MRGGRGRGQTRSRIVFGGVGGVHYSGTESGSLGTGEEEKARSFPRRRAHGVGVNSRKGTFD